MKILPIWLVLLLLGGCASSSNKVATLLRSQVKQADYVGALKTVESNKFYKRKESILLKELEKGMIYFRQGEYSKSLSFFEKAKATSDRLYTKSISKKVVALMTNSNADNYYGERYERSLIRFYLSLNNLLIYQQGFKKIPDPKLGEKRVDLSQKERINHLSAARAYILDWDSQLKNFQVQEAGNSTYKNDMLAKVFGAFVHQKIGSGSERQIARQLYKDAKKLIIRNYGAYPTFNYSSSSYRKNFKKFPSLGEKKVKEKYLRLTPHGQFLQEYIDEQLKNLKNSKRIKVVVSTNLIAKKKPKKIDVFVPIIDVTPIRLKGAMAFGTFVRKMLSAARGTRPSITFELPQVEMKKTKYSMVLVAKNQAGKEVSKIKLAIIDPISDIAYEALDEKIAGIRTKVGARIAMKHATALVAAYATYKTMYKNNSFLAFLSATAGYAAANKAIAASESADVRFWATLPHDVRLGDIELKPGKYHFFINKKSAQGNLFVTDLGIHEVKSETALLNFSTF